jgi:hypothetical protein
VGERCNLLGWAGSRTTRHPGKRPLGIGNLAHLHPRTSRTSASDASRTFQGRTGSYTHGVCSEPRAPNTAHTCLTPELPTTLGEHAACRFFVSLDRKG